MSSGDHVREPVLVVEDDAACRALIVSLLDRVGCTVVEGATGEEALELARKDRPALVLLDVGIPGVSGYEVCHELREAYGEALPILFVSGSRVESTDRVAGLLIGGDDYIVKPFDPDELLARVRRLLVRKAAALGPQDSPAEEIAPALTVREQEVLTLLARGRTQRQIADELVISSKTVASHIQRLLAKLGVHSRAEAVAMAYQRQLVEPTPETVGTPG